MIIIDQNTMQSLLQSTPKEYNEILCMYQEMFKSAMSEVPQEITKTHKPEGIDDDDFVDLIKSKTLSVMQDLLLNDKPLELPEDDDKYDAMSKYIIESYSESVKIMTISERKFIFNFCKEILV